MSLPAAETQKEQAIYPCQKFQGHSKIIYGVIHLPDGQRIMTCSIDGSLRVWNLETGRQIGNDWRDGESEVASIALSLNGKKVVSGVEDGAIRVWDMDTGKVVTKWTGHSRSAVVVSWSRDSARIMSGCFDGTARVWDVESGKTILEIKTGLGNIYTYGAIYSPDETMIATGGGNEEKEFLKIWDAKTGKLLVKNLEGHTRDVTCLAWTPDGSTLISGSHDFSIRTWNTTTWQQVATLKEHTNFVIAIAISPNGRILASASEDTTVRLWNIENGHLVGSPLQHPDAVCCLSFSTDGKLLATGCRDNNAYTWDMCAIGDGLDELLENEVDKSILEAVATQHRNQRCENARRTPPHFFDDSPHHPHSPTSHHTPLPPACQYHAPGPTLLTRISSLFRRTHYNTHDIIPRPRFPNSVQNPFSGVHHRGQDEDIGLEARRAAVVDVPFAQGNPRSYSAREAQMKEEKAKQEKKMDEQRQKLGMEKARDAKNASASSSQLPQSSGAQKSEAAQTHQTSQLSSSSVTPAVVATSGVTTSTILRPGIMIIDAGPWTRFRLFICCISTRQTDDHH